MLANRHDRGEIRLRRFQRGCEKKNGDTRVLDAGLNGYGQGVGSVLVEQLGRQPGEDVAQPRQSQASYDNLEENIKVH